ncbi:glycosyltransferase family 2 protein [Occultella glacieicola]|uniref:glycosyltransferase family 2 protein n=1 Tax=Occultella glacieicola TaxID=2518684 RepID=UPI00140547BA|nr:glycosyltransferase [Occultella glacieicola]
MADLLIGALLLAALVAASRLARDLRTLPDTAERRLTGATVSVVVPARDEEAVLPALLRSVHRVDGGVREVVVVDDASRDATASVARAGGATVLPAGDPPAGWTGKAWACHVGALATSADLLLFLDADTVLAPHALAGLLALHDRYPGLVSIQPFHTVGEPYEHLSAYFNAVSVLASGAFRRRPRGRPLAFGPCLLTSRAHYERVGGHAAVRHEILDDVELAAAYDRAGLPVRCAIGGRSVRMRSYPGGIRQLADGWTKNFASGATAAAPGPVVAAVAWVIAHHAVAVGALLAAWALLAGHAVPLGVGHPALWAVAWVAVSGQLRWVLRRLGSFGWWTWALFPVPLLAFDLVFARSVVRTTVRRSVRWRGREVPVDRPNSTERRA